VGGTPAARRRPHYPPACPHGALVPTHKPGVIPTNAEESTKKTATQRVASLPLSPDTCGRGTPAVGGTFTRRLPAACPPRFLAGPFGGPVVGRLLPPSPPPRRLCQPPALVRRRRFAGGQISRRLAVADTARPGHACLANSASTLLSANVALNFTLIQLPVPYPYAVSLHLYNGY